MHRWSREDGGELRGMKSVSPRRYEPKHLLLSSTQYSTYYTVLIYYQVHCPPVPSANPDGISTSGPHQLTVSQTSESAGRCA